MQVEVPDLDDVEFEGTCRWCHGWQSLCDKVCSRCGGTGTQLTPVGQRLLDFLTKIGVPMTTLPKGWKPE